MKESLHNGRHDPPDGGRRVIEDIDAVRALAHPHRVAILQYLLSGPPRTATDCAAEVGGTPSACSYHLRELERYGLVERAERADGGGDGRTRPWRAAAVGFSIGAGAVAESPAGRAAELALTGAELVENQRLLKRFLDAGDEVEREWREASELRTFELLATPAELSELNERIVDLLLTYRASVRVDAPGDARPVHVVHQAFPRLAGPG